MAETEVRRLVLDRPAQNPVTTLVSESDLITSGTKLAKTQVMR